MRGKLESKRRGNVCGRPGRGRREFWKRDKWGTLTLPCASVVTLPPREREHFGRWFTYVLVNHRIIQDCLVLLNHKDLQPLCRARLLITVVLSLISLVISSIRRGSTYLQNLAFQTRIGRLNSARYCLFSQILIVTLLIRSFSACMTMLQRQGNLGTNMCFQA